METLYKKVGRKYVECGVMDFPYFENGNWLVVANGSLTSYMKVGDGADLRLLATEKRLKEKLCDVARRKKDPIVMWSNMEKPKPIKLTKKQQEANKAFCDAFKVSHVWCDVNSLMGSVEEVVETAIKELNENN